MPATLPTLVDTNTLIKVVPNLLVSQNFLLDTFFQEVITADSEFVTIDVDIGKRRVAPYCSPMVEGKLVEQRKYQSNVFKPPYIKDKRAPDLLKPLRRHIGERIGGNESAQERFEANIYAELTDQIDMINRRMELQAAQALTTGTVTCSGDGFPTTVIDFGRDATLTTANTGTALWDSGNVAASPSGDIETFGNAMLKKSGAVPTDIIFSPTAWKYFIKDPTVFAAVNTDVHLFTNPGKNNLQFGPQVKHGAIMKGVYGGYRLWVYNDWYVNDSGQEVRMIPDGTIIIVSQQMLGLRAYGQIIDPRHNYQSMAYAPKAWVNEDPAQQFLLMQSSPLVIPSRPNASMCVTVTAAVQP